MVDTVVTGASSVMAFAAVGGDKVGGESVALDDGGAVDVDGNVVAGAGDDDADGDVNDSVVVLLAVAVEADSAMNGICHL